MTNLAVAVSRTKITEVRGTFQRHTGPHVTSVVGSPAGGRWGRPGAYPVLYLGRPTDAVVGEAYRHLVDDIEGMTGDTVGPALSGPCRWRSPTSSTSATRQAWQPSGSQPVTCTVTPTIRLPADPRRLRVVRTREAGNYC